MTFRAKGFRGPKGAHPDNKTGFRVTGYRLLLSPEGGETKTESGLVIPESAALNAETHNVLAQVIEVGEDCWKDNISDFCQVGDTVLVGKFAGKFEKSPVDGKRYRFLNDLDVIAVLDVEDK